MRIAEIYESLQGEGLLAGTPSLFIRTSGCNLRCVWCDTPFTSWEPEGEDWPLARVIDRVRAAGPSHAVVTGGEPLLATDLPDLCAQLRADGIHVTIETAGTIAPPRGGEPLADLMSISPKLASSAPPDETPAGWKRRHDAARRRDDVLRELMAGPHQIKFVIDTPADLAEARGWLEDLGSPVVPAAVLLMPQGRTPAELAAKTDWLEPECRRLGFHLAPRHHIAWFGNVRRT